MTIDDVVSASVGARCCVVLSAVVAHAAGRSDVADAAQNGDRAAVQKLIRQKADVNAPQVDGATALHWAVYRDDLELAGMLLRGRRTSRRRTATA